MGGGGWGVVQTLSWVAKFEFGVEMAWDGVVGVDWTIKNGVALGVAMECNLGLVLGWTKGWLEERGGMGWQLGWGGKGGLMMPFCYIQIRLVPKHAGVAGVTIKN